MDVVDYQVVSHAYALHSFSLPQLLGACNHAAASENAVTEAAARDCLGRFESLFENFDGLDTQFRVRDSSRAEIMHELESAYEEIMRCPEALEDLRARLASPEFHEQLCRVEQTIEFLKGEELSFADRAREARLALIGVNHLIATLQPLVEIDDARASEIEGSLKDARLLLHKWQKQE